MTRHQRILIAVTLALFAWLLHVSYCDWTWREPVSGNVPRRSVRPLMTLRHDAPDGSTLATGLVTQPHVDPQAALWLGILAPLALIAVDAFLILGWRQQDRVRKGLCPQCGYDLRGDKAGSTSACPECGFRRSSSPGGPTPNP
ncbi:MAG: hypothetical protein L0Y44_08170 [Phycisphaerales bacterium]|nr:hypothetical protein [Phycisphaerales bacterium]